MISAALLALLFGLGAATGFAAGLLGVGGGMLLVPFLTMILTGQGVSPERVVKVIRAG